MVWKYIGEVIFNMLVLVGLIKGSDQIIKTMLTESTEFVGNSHKTITMEVYVR